MSAAGRGGTLSSRRRAHGRHVQGAGRPGSAPALLPGRGASERGSLRLRHTERGGFPAHGQPSPEEAEGGRTDNLRAPRHLGLLPGGTWGAARHGADALAQGTGHLRQPRRPQPGLLSGSEQVAGQASSASRSDASSPAGMPATYGAKPGGPRAPLEFVVMAEPYRNHSDLSGRPGGERYSERLIVRSVPVPDPGEDFLSQIPVPAAVAWVRQGAGLVGWGEAARVTLPAGADRFTAGEKWLHAITESAAIDDAVRRRGSGLVAFGTFTFDDASDGSVLVVPEAVLGRDGTGNAWLTTITADGGPDESAGARPAGAWPHSVSQHGVSQHGVSQRSVIQPYVAPGAVGWHDGSLSA